MRSKISIIIPTYNEGRYIVSCLDSILESDYPSEDMEVLIVDGMSTDDTRSYVEEYRSKHNFIKLLDNEKKFTPMGMNIGIKESKGEFIFVISAHAEYPKDYFSSLVEYSLDLKADCIGAVLSTSVKHQNAISNSIKTVLSSKFGVGNSDFRIGVAEVKEVDTVPFGCYRKDTFEKYGYYDERLIRNQDIELNKRIVNGGGRIYLVPDVQCTYYARDNLIDLYRNNYSNGKWNILTAYYTRTLSSLSTRHFVPLIFILSILIPAFVSFWFHKAIYLSIVSFGSYLLLVILMSQKLKNNENSFLYLAISFFILHLSYGWGSLAGIFSVITKYIKGDR